MWIQCYKTKEKTRMYFISCVARLKIMVYLIIESFFSSKNVMFELSGILNYQKLVFRGHLFEQEKWYWYYCVPDKSNDNLNCFDSIYMVSVSTPEAYLIHT